MRKARIPAQQQYQLIMQCRQSGLSDHQWCLEHDIHPGTFYNWVRRLRQNPDFVIPERTAPQSELISRQEVVKVELTASDAPAPCQEKYPKTFCDATAVMELSFHSIVLRIPNGTDPQLLGHLLSVLKELPC